MSAVFLFSSNSPLSSSSNPPTLFYPLPLVLCPFLSGWLCPIHGTDKNVSPRGCWEEGRSFSHDPLPAALAGHRNGGPTVAAVLHRTIAVQGLLSPSAGAGQGLPGQVWVGPPSFSPSSTSPTGAIAWEALQGQEGTLIKAHTGLILCCKMPSRNLEINK